MKEYRCKLINELGKNGNLLQIAIQSMEDAYKFSGKESSISFDTYRKDVLYVYVSLLEAMGEVAFDNYQSSLDRVFDLLMGLWGEVDKEKNNADTLEYFSKIMNEIKGFYHSVQEKRDALTTFPNMKGGCSINVSISLDG